MLRRLHLAHVHARNTGSRISPSWHSSYSVLFCRRSVMAPDLWKPPGIMLVLATCTFFYLASSSKSHVENSFRPSSKAVGSNASSGVAICIAGHYLHKQIGSGHEMLLLMDSEHTDSCTCHKLECSLQSELGSVPLHIMAPMC